MVDFYYESVQGMEDSLFNSAIKYFYEEQKFPTVGDIASFNPEQENILADWFLIMAVVKGNQKSAEISGISDLALTIVTSTNTALGAMRLLIDANDFQTSKIRADWEKAISISPNPNVLPPVKVRITFEIPTIKVDGEDRDTNYAHRTAAMIRCISEKKAISAAWIPMIDSYPAEKRKKIYDFAAVNNFTALGETKSLFYKRSISIAEAMKSIDENAINKQIANHNYSLVN
jgi:hypothetical protein